MAKKRINTRPDSMLVEADHIIRARQGLGENGPAQGLDALAEREPALAAYIQEGLAAMAGKLTLSGAPTQVVQGVYTDALTMVLSSIESQRLAHYDLWKNTTVGTLLEDLGQAEKPRRKPRKRKDQLDEESA